MIPNKYTTLSSASVQNVVDKLIDKINRSDIVGLHSYTGTMTINFKKGETLVVRCSEIDNSIYDIKGKIKYSIVSGKTSLDITCQQYESIKSAVDKRVVEKNKELQEKAISSILSILED